MLEQLETNLPWSGEVKAVFHQGACTRTTELDGRLMMRDNYEYSRRLLELCIKLGWPLIYASSASVYGRGEVFAEEPANERPANVYAYSKYLLSKQVERKLDESEERYKRIVEDQTELICRCRADGIITFANFGLNIFH